MLGLWGPCHRVCATDAEVAFYMRIAWLLFVDSGYGRTVPRESSARLFVGSGVRSTDPREYTPGVLKTTVVYQGSDRFVYWDLGTETCIFSVMPRFSQALNNEGISGIYFFFP